MNATNKYISPSFFYTELPLRGFKSLWETHKLKGAVFMKLDEFDLYFPEGLELTEGELAALLLFEDKELEKW